MGAHSKVVVFYAVIPGFETLAYHDQWTEAWLSHPGIQITAINLSRPLGLKDATRILAADLIVFLHSTNSNEFVFPWRLRKLLWGARSKKALFVGNEYKLMPDKISLIDDLGIDLICSQLPEKSAKWLYAPCRHAEVISVPHALDKKRYHPQVPICTRSIDIGVRAYEYPWYLGDRDRAEIIETFISSPKIKELKTDLSMDPKERFTGDGWASFLNQCRSTISTEAGAKFLQRDDELRKRVNQYQELHPEATFTEINDLFFKNGVPESVSGKTLSSRHFEAIGTKTAQIMFPGEFNGILKADVHYIALKRDYSNLDAVLENVKNTEALEKMTTETLEYCLAEHQLSHRIESVVKKALR